MRAILRIVSAHTQDRRLVEGDVITSRHTRSAYLGALLAAALMMAIAVPSTGASTGPPTRPLPPTTASKAVAPPTLDEITAFLVPGASAGLSVEVQRTTVCRLSFSGPRHLRSGPFAVKATQPYILFSWRLPHRVAPGAWKARLSCRAKGARKTSLFAGTLTTNFQVSGKSHGRGLGFVEPGSFRIRFSRTAPAVKPDGGPQFLSGRGAGGFESCQCTGYAFSRRPDIYNYAASKGFGGGNWNGGFWGERAAEAGELTGDLPEVGALVSFKPGVDGTPGPAGHVGYVESVAPDGKHFTMSSKNGLLCNEVVYWNYNVLAVGRANGMTFIYGPPGSPAPSGGPGPGSTPPPPPPSIGGRGGVVNSPNGDQSVYFVGSDGGIHVWLYHGRWEEQELGGSVAPDTSPIAFENPTGNTFVYYVGNDEAIHLWLWNGSKWEDQNLGGSVAPGASPTAFEDAAGNQSVYFVGSDGGIHVWLYHGRWEEQELGGSVAPDTSPIAFENSAGTVLVYYVGSDGAIHLWLWNGSKWEDQNLGGSVATGTSPSSFTDAAGNQSVYFVGSDGGIHVWLYHGRWEEQELGGSVAPDTSPIAFENSAGTVLVYYVGSDGAIHLWLWNGSKWEDQTVGGSVAPTTSPIAFTESSTGSQFVYFIGSDHSIHLWLYGTRWEEQNLGGSAASGTSPDGF